MSDPAPFRPEAKVLADLLALVVGDSQPQAEAAIEAIRRRAARDGVTGGALKALVHRLLAEVAPRAESAEPADVEREVADLHWIVEDQKRELEQTRHARQITEHAMSDTRRTNASLADRIGGLNRARRAAWAMGFLLGIAATCLGYAGIGALRHIHFGAPAPSGIPGQQASLNRAATLQLDEFLHNCFLGNVNSLGSGSFYDMRLSLDISADGQITHASGQTDLQGPDAQDKRQFSEMLLRTLGNGSCGKLPLPPSLQGKTSHLDLWLGR